jgi:alpha-ribazole phosphatase
MRLWLVRHAVPLVDAGTCYGALDMAADAQATQQAALALAQTLPTAVTLHSSPLQRCTQLAAALCALRTDLTFTIDQRLREMDFGTWEGQRWDALGAATLQAWTDDFAHHCPGGGESVHSFMARVAQAWNDAASHSTEQVWITHAGVIRAAALLYEGRANVTQAAQWPAAACGFGQWRVLDRL